MGVDLHSGLTPLGLEASDAADTIDAYLSRNKTSTAFIFTVPAWTTAPQLSMLNSENVTDSLQRLACESAARFRDETLIQNQIAITRQSIFYPKE